MRKLIFAGCSVIDRNCIKLISKIDAQLCIALYTKSPSGTGTSGRPAKDVPSEITAARAAVDAAICQSTDPSVAAVVGSIAIKLWAKVLTARTAAAAAHLFQYSLVLIFLLLFLWSRELMLTKTFRIVILNMLLRRLPSVIDELRVRLAVFVINVDVIKH